jgi:hypothetical protein
MKSSTSYKFCECGCGAVLTPWDASDWFKYASCQKLWLASVGRDDRATWRETQRLVHLLMIRARCWDSHMPEWCGETTPEQMANSYGMPYRKVIEVWWEDWELDWGRWNFHRDDVVRMSAMVGEYLATLDAQESVSHG